MKYSQSRWLTLASRPLADPRLRHSARADTYLGSQHSDEDASCASAPEAMEIVFLWAYAWNPEPEILNPENLDLEGVGTRSMRELRGIF